MFPVGTKRQGQTRAEYVKVVTYGLECGTSALGNEGRPDIVNELWFAVLGSGSRDGRRCEQENRCEDRLQQHGSQRVGSR